DHAAHVDPLGPAVDGTEVLAVGLPVPVEAVEDGGGGDVLDRLHHLGQVRPVLGSAGGEGHPAVPQHDGGDAVPARRCRRRVPGELGVEVGVDVDEARRHDGSGRVDGGGGRTDLGPVQLADGDDRVAPDGKVARHGIAPGAV